MDILFLIGSFFAGVVTVLAPCVLPLLPVIVGGSMSGKVEDKKRPLIVTASLAASLILFTILLKATTLFISVPPETFTYISGGILILLGILLFFPNIYDEVIIRLNLQARSQRLLGKSAGKGKWLGAIVTGAALGPVFSSCSPAYVYIIATVLPVNFGVAMIYMISYVIGLSLMLLLVGYLGQRFLRRIKGISNPKGAFIRTLAAIFIAVGLLIVSGYDKKFQTYVSENTVFNFDGFSQSLIPKGGIETDSSSGVLNVAPGKKAPEFVGLENWINSDPLTVEKLKGKVVLIDFWTYSCINCIRTQPYLRAWHDAYKDSGLVIVGLHAPEFAFEKNPASVKQAAEKANLKYPIALDNDFSTWNAYDNQYWPATYLIDKDGEIRRFHAGEGEYKETEEAIRLLLKDAGNSVPEKMTMAVNGTVPVSNDQTPETYLGTQRASRTGNYEGSQRLINGTNTYTQAALSRVNAWTLGGTWEVDAEGITARSNATLKIRVSGKEMYVVTASDVQNQKMQVLLDGTPISQTKSAGKDVKDSMITLNKAQLYRAVEFDSLQKDKAIELRVPAGVKLNALTFGS